MPEHKDKSGGTEHERAVKAVRAQVQKLELEEKAAKAVEEAAPETKSGEDGELKPEK